MLSEYFASNKKRYVKDHSNYMDMRKREGPNKQELKPCINFIKLYKETIVKKSYKTDIIDASKQWHDPSKTINDGRYC